MSRKKTRSNGVDSGGPKVIPQIPVNKFLEHVEARAWTDAEKELDIIRQKSDNSQWSRGYVKALEGLMLTYRTNDDKYIFLPRVLATRTEDTISNLKKEFSKFALNKLHGEYNQGYFKALDDYFTLLGSRKNQQTPAKTRPPKKPPLTNRRLVRTRVNDCVKQDCREQEPDDVATDSQCYVLVWTLQLRWTIMQNVLDKEYGDRVDSDSHTDRPRRS